MGTKKKSKISFSLILNIFVILMSVGLVIYFFISPDGLMDLLRNSPGTINWIWVFVAFVAFMMNIVMDVFVTYFFIRSEFKSFTMWDAVKTSCVGQFFSAITPSSTGGQPMQIYLLSKMGISAGFSTSCMTQKFIVYQLTTTAISIFAIFLRFDYFVATMDTPYKWSLVILGFVSQIGVTTFLLIVSFCRGLSKKLLNLVSKIMHKLRFIKNPDEKTLAFEQQIENFHEANKNVFRYKKRMVLYYLLVFCQVIFILICPYLLYRAFGFSGASPVDMVCAQAYVNLTSSLIPLPGSSGIAEFAYNMFMAEYFANGTLKSAILIWRFITYYAVIVCTAPFSRFTSGKNKQGKRQSIDDRLINSVNNEMFNEDSDEKQTSEN
ncbi:MULTISPECIES: lysylphosphatidylglycerol synthase transmembrane domain-containing protein [unclassified Ruminococcus]|uniref:lysylphosphatidylglycerol synthase transmembrane domain-containing protein n=1 Tax=unclassified Ruminococcus TaxID=2608920 RepID=UPI0021093D34|nr:MULTISPECIES: lysylphosphatidylglycerol synthase transmembrane domain-containing protein [unclassified Ruminococcus]MCQ4022208.1 flippase-like domain-containing protein [Ruminococcus sp. zg-924]MCQ4115229.1 flippase-like domain-containing protein [Ruminococcus sp. zg-921]